MITVRVESVINFNGQELRKTAEANVSDDHPELDEIANKLMASISFTEPTANISAQPREWWIALSEDKKTVCAGMPYFGGHPIGVIHVREVFPSEGKP